MKDIEAYASISFYYSLVKDKRNLTHQVNIEELIYFGKACFFSSSDALAVYSDSGSSSVIGKNICQFLSRKFQVLKMGEGIIRMALLGRNRLENVKTYILVYIKHDQLNIILVV